MSKGGKPEGQVYDVTWSGGLCGDLLWSGDSCSVKTTGDTDAEKMFTR